MIPFSGFGSLIKKGDGECEGVTGVKELGFIRWVDFTDPVQEPPTLGFWLRLFKMETYPLAFLFFGCCFSTSGSTEY